MEKENKKTSASAQKTDKKAGTLLSRFTKTQLVAGGALLSVFVVFVLSVTVLKSKGGSPQGRGGRGGSGATVSVKTMTVENTVLHGYVNTNGEVESQNSVSVFPDMGGKVMSTSVMLGSTVKKNDIIAYVDPSEPGTNYRSSPVYAPISGSIISTPLKNGTKVTTSTAIAIIGDINNLQVTANVPERYVSLLRTGLKAEISVEAYPDVVFKATVKRVSPVVDSQSRTKEMILTFDEHDERINAGMFAKVKLYTKDYSGFPVIPSDALVQNGEEFFAYVVQEDSTVKKVKVTKGEQVDGMVQLTSGVSSGEKVVIQGMSSLGDGSKVNDITDGKQAKPQSASEHDAVKENPGANRKGQ